MDDSGGLVTKDGRELAFGVLAGLGVHISVTQCVSDDLDTNLASLRGSDLNVGKSPGSVSLEDYGSLADNSAVSFDHTVLIVFVFKI